MTSRSAKTGISSSAGSPIGLRAAGSSTESTRLTTELRLRLARAAIHSMHRVPARRPTRSRNSRRLATWVRERSTRRGIVPRSQLPAADEPLPLRQYGPQCVRGQDSERPTGRVQGFPPDGALHASVQGGGLQLHQHAPLPKSAANVSSMTMSATGAIVNANNFMAITSASDERKFRFGLRLTF